MLAPSAMNPAGLHRLTTVARALLDASADRPHARAQCARPAGFLLRAGLALSGLLELVGVTVAIGLLVLTLQGNPPARSRPGLQQVLPLLGTAFVGFWLGALANLLAVLEVALGDNGTGGALDRLAILPALYLFLIPIAVGMGARVFPLHFGAKQADQRLLRLGLALLLLGVLARVAGDWAGEAHIRPAGLALLPAGLCLFVIGVRVFAARRAVPGQRRRWYKDPASGTASLTPRGSGWIRSRSLSQPSQYQAAEAQTFQSMRSDTSSAPGSSRFSSSVRVPSCFPVSLVARTMTSDGSAPANRPDWLAPQYAQ